MKPILVAAGLLALAWAAWLTFSTTQEGALAAPPADLDEIALPTMVQPGTAPDSRLDAESAAPPAGRIKREEAPAASVEGEGFLLRVVEAESGRPIPFAEVFYSADPAELEQEDEDLLADIFGTGDLSASADLFHRAGADGTLRLPAPNADAGLVARKDDWFGVVDVPRRPPAEVEVLCQRGQPAAARVRDAAGTPQAGVRVMMCVQDDLDLVALFGVLTDAAGMARFRHLEFLLGDESWDGPFLLAVEGLLGAGSAVEFDPRAPPAEFIELRLPERGRVELWVLGADGLPLAEAAVAELSVVQEDDFGWDGPSQILRVKVRDGLAPFAPVAVGLKVHAQAWLADGTLVGAASGPGPNRAGETARLDVRADAGATFLTGRLLGLDGKPLAHARLDWHWSGELQELELFDPFASAGFRIGEASLRTDEAGGFRLEVESAELGAGVQESLTLVQKLERRSGPSVTVLLTGPLPLGEVELGDLRLTQAPLIAAGTVVDESGAALAGIRLIANLQREDGRPQWFGGIEYGEVMSAEDGSFEMRGSADGALLILHGESSRHCSDFLPIALGQSGIRLVMREFGSLHGRVIAGPGANLDGLSLELEAIEPKDLSGALRIVELEGGQEFHFSEVRPGRHALTVSRGSNTLPLGVIEDLLVLSGEACADSRIQPLDLTGSMDCIALRVQAADGLPIEKFKVGTQLGVEYFTVRGSGMEPVLLPRIFSHSEVVVYAENYLTIRLKSVTSDRTVNLLPGPPVQIVIDNWQQLPSVSVLLITVMPAATSGTAYRSGSSVVVVPQEAAVFPGLSSLGACNVLIDVFDSSKEGHGKRVAQLTRQNSIEVLALSELQTFHLTLSEDELSQIRAGLGEK